MLGALISQNLMSGKRPTQIIDSSSWIPKNPTLSLRVLSLDSGWLQGHLAKLQGFCELHIPLMMALQARSC